MKEPKQTIVWRKDLKVRKGKFASQIAHGSLKIFFDRIDPDSFIQNDDGNYSCTMNNITPEMKEWMEGIFTKIVVGCQSEEEVYELEVKAKTLKIPYAIITDCGKTEFNNIPTVTCIALGPYKAEVLEELTKNYSLM